MAAVIGIVTSVLGWVAVRRSAGHVRGMYRLSIGMALNLRTLLEGVGLGLLTACVNFLLLCGAMWIWLAFFFAT